MKVQRTPQELCEFLRKLNIRFCIVTCIFALVMLGFGLYSFLGFEDDTPFAIKVILIIIVLIGAINFIVYGVKLRQLKKQIDGMKDTAEQEVEREKE